jgi:predicted dinucleotide-binding enzyme
LIAEQLAGEQLAVEAHANRRTALVALRGELDLLSVASVSAFIRSLGLRPRDAGDLSMAHWLEGAGLLSVGLGRYGVGSFDFSLGVNLS